MTTRIFPFHVCIGCGALKLGFSKIPFYYVVHSPFQSDPNPRITVSVILRILSLSNCSWSFEKGWFKRLIRKTGMRFLYSQHRINTMQFPLSSIRSEHNYATCWVVKKRQHTLQLIQKSWQSRVVQVIHIFSCMSFGHVSDSHSILFAYKASRLTQRRDLDSLGRIPTSHIWIAL